MLYLSEKWLPDFKWGKAIKKRLETVGAIINIPEEVIDKENKK